MSNPKTNKDQELPPQKGITSANTDKQSHFVQARQIINRWPKWKREIRCMPTSTNSDQSTQVPDKT